MFLCNTQHAKAQIYAEFGIPTIAEQSIYVDLTKRFGLYCDLGYQFDKFGVNAKFYFGPDYSYSRNSRGFGQDFYYVHRFKKKKVEFQPGIGYMLLNKRDERNSFFDSNSQMLLVTAKAVIWLNKHLSLVTGFSYGYGRQNMYNFRNYKPTYGVYIPYFSSFGIRYSFKGRL